MVYDCSSTTRGLTVACFDIILKCVCVSCCHVRVENWYIMLSQRSQLFCLAWLLPLSLMAREARNRYRTEVQNPFPLVLTARRSGRTRRPPASPRPRQAAISSRSAGKRLRVRIASAKAGAWQRPQLAEMATSLLIHMLLEQTVRDHEDKSTRLASSKKRLACAVSMGCAPCESQEGSQQRNAFKRVRAMSAIMRSGVTDGAATIKMYPGLPRSQHG